ncbi:nitroreductase family protein [Priestia taiwanensis]|uniref:NAD(P)H nitroreductase YodC n=1 Tax=Priestia taiwanensis TaxID=1347902 RepID=A0A917ARU6_9BACI|nr:nitroreductase family protein [Priestia taiwanensis]MBM7363840.1 nitroreductase [Priestia taiwanensis]GGE69416.1 putative NAD(P)H nitroreductase YodC [Priestia taiwanensis]
MTKSFTEIAQERRSVKIYDTEVEISNEELTEILEVTTKSPSSWNLQHWRFVVIKSKEAKEKLLPIAYNQQQVADASATVMILGDTESYRNFDEVFLPAVKAGFLAEEVANALHGQINGAYSDKQKAREAGLINGSLAAMTFMYAAQERGWRTNAIGGFHAPSFMKEFNIDERYTPIMLITIGKEKQPGRPTPRLSVERMTEWK